MQAADLARAAGGSGAPLERMLTAHGKLLDAVRADAGREELVRVIRVLARSQFDLLPEAQRKGLGDLDQVIETMLGPQVSFMQSRWLRYFIDFDPAEALAGVKVPVLAFFGERDMQVPPAVNRAPFEAALARASNQQVTIKVFPEANHLFQTARTGNPSEYSALPKMFVPALLDDLSAWVMAR